MAYFSNSELIVIIKIKNKEPKKLFLPYEIKILYFLLYVYKKYLRYNNKKTF